MKNVFYTAVLILIFTVPPAIAANRPTAEELLKENLTAVFVILNKQSLSPDAKKNEIERIVNPLFDFSLMAKLTLGRKFWPGLSADQRERFTELFIERLRNSYLDRLTLYTDEKVQYEPAVAVKKKVQIPTYLVSKDDKISILYKFYDSSSGWRIYDLEVQGVSIIRSYRSQFHEILRSGSFDDLLAKLEKSPEDQQ
ncbi:MAG: ABC transporter substrate-binding protein [Desulfobacterales bacterium]|nr:ABC transporter substrate-binding protein [Desulfobacterales bacterium]